MIRKIKTSRNKNKKRAGFLGEELLAPHASLRLISCSRPKSPRLRWAEDRSYQLCNHPCSEMVLNQKDLQLLLRMSLFRRSKLISLVENWTKASSTTKSRLPQFGNLLYCKSFRNLQQNLSRLNRTFVTPSSTSQHSLFTSIAGSLCFASLLGSTLATLSCLFSALR